TGDYGALVVRPTHTLNSINLLPVTKNHVTVPLHSGGTITTPIPSGISALLAPLEFHVEDVKRGSTIKAELFIPDNFKDQTNAYMRFNYRTRRFEEYVDSNGKKLYRLLDENTDGKVDRIIFSMTDGDRQWDGDHKANGVIVDPSSPINAILNFAGSNKRDQIQGNLLANKIRGKAGNDRLIGGLGRDVIHGGKNKDRIIGGEHGDLLQGGHGKDLFIYHSAADSSADNLYQQDLIRHFHKKDRINLRHFDADPSQAGTQHFNFIGKRIFTGETGQLRFKSGLLSADLDGDRIADFAVAIDGKLHAHQLLLGS
ncbi:MAG: choice-of-anchor U domain-containing protein, partial [Burkholderiaceae bacterium]